MKCLTTWVLHLKEIAFTISHSTCKIRLTLQISGISRLAYVLTTILLLVHTLPQVSLSVLNRTRIQIIISTIRPSL